MGGDFYKRCGGRGLEGAFELAAGGVDVATAGLADEGGDAAVAEALLEDAHVLRSGFVEGHVGTGVPNDQIDFGAEILQRAISSSACSRWSLMPPSRTYSKVTRSRGRKGTVEMASRRAAMFHLRVMGMMDSRTTSFEALRLTASLGRTVSLANRSIPGRMPEVLTVMRDSGMRMAAGQKTDGVHKARVVQKWLAHTHEDQVDPVAADFDVMAVEDGGDLSGYLAGGEVAADAKFGGEAELAVDGAAYLAGDADGGALVVVVIVRWDALPLRRPGFRRRVRRRHLQASRRSRRSRHRPCE